jgi:nucleotidyltransferase/DNA polymerase involved in DNA repair
MAFLCCRLPDLALVVHWQRHPEWRGQALVIGGAPHERAVVRACSAEAADAGVAVGMPLHQAQQRCPAATFVAPDDEGMELLGQRLLQLFYQLAPEVEWDASGRVFVNLAGLAVRWPRLEALLQRVDTILEAALGVRPCLGVGANKFVGRVAVEQARPGKPCIVPSGEEAVFLAPLSITLAPVAAEILERLALLGLRTLGAVAGLPEPALAQQFGPEGARLYALAHGLDSSPLVPWTPPVSLREKTSFDPPLADREALLFVGRRLTDRLAERLGAAALACAQLAVHLEGEDTPAWREEERLPAARSGGDLWFPVARLLRRARPTGPIAALTLEAARLQPRVGRQLRLLVRLDAGEERIQEALLRLQEQFRPALVRRPRLLDPLAPLAERRFELTPT